MASNSGRWKVFQNAQSLHGPSGIGQNLNDDLEQALGNDLDALMLASVGDGVFSGWAVAAGAGLAVTLTPGEGFAGGQHCRSTGTGGVVSLPASTALIRIYVSATGPWDSTLAAWPTNFAFTTGALVGGQLLLAEVATSGSAVTSVTDKRLFIQTNVMMMGAVNDAITPIAVATSVLQRFSMLAARIKAIIGGADWLAAVPASLTSLAASLAAPFHATTGHKHTGVTGDAPKLAQAVTHETPDTNAAGSSLHHTIGAGPTQAAAGNHGHASDPSKSDVGHVHTTADVTSGLFALARLVAGTPDGTKFFKDNQTLAIPPGQVDTQIFTAAGAFTWTKPSWATATSHVTVIMYGGGEGGASGGSATDPNDSQVKASGGNGGWGASYEVGQLLAGDLGATEPGVVGAGGLGGVPTGGTPNPGGSGSDSTFKNFVARHGSTIVQGGTPGQVLWPGATPGVGASATPGIPSSPGNKAYRGGGGGGGGGGTGGAAGSAGGNTGQFAAGTGGGGVAPGGAGAAGSSAKAGDGGAGGSSSVRPGGAGGAPGGGGGGGGSGGLTAGLQGVGGAGAPGKVWVITRQ